MRYTALLLFSFSSAAEVHDLTLPQAIGLAIKQNPEVVIARLEEQKAAQAVRVARDPFSPRIGVGSGLAYSHGFPMSIEGSAPSIVQARASQYIFNRRQSYLVAQARENARGAGIAAQVTAEDIAFQAASLYLDAERAARLREQAQRQVESLEKIAQATALRVKEGRELPVESSRVQLSLARGRQLAETLEGDQEFAERSLAVTLGFPAQDRVRPRGDERRPPAMPDSEELAVKQAVETNRQMRRLESAAAAKELEIRAHRAARLPTVDLFAQYGLFAKFNNYEDFFQRFQRHNGQIGVSFQIPVLAGPAVSALAAQGRADVERLRAEMDSLRNRIALDTRAALRQVREAATAQKVARLDLDVARETLSVMLAQMEEGRATLRQVEESRFAENQKWIAFYDAQYAVEKARWNLARLTGDLTPLAATADAAVPPRNPDGR
jgi:outer membrane protein TolC